MTGIPEPLATFEIEVDMWQEGNHVWTTNKEMYHGYGLVLTGNIVDGVLEASTLEIGDQVRAWLTGSAKLVSTSQTAFQGPFVGIFDATEPYSRNRQVEGMIYGQKTTATQSLVIRMRTDRPAYEQGEAVTITGEVLYDNKPVPPEYWSNKGPPISRLNIRVEVPGAKNPGLLPSVTTDESGQFSIMPLAGWNIGEYELTALAYVQLESGEKVDGKSETTFKVVEAADVWNMERQLMHIIELYEREVPEGPIRTSRSDAEKLYLPRWFDFDTAESNFGSYENTFIAGTTLDPQSDFVCGGYQKQVLKFMNSLRFDKDPKVRELLKGLDYGPIARGVPPTPSPLGDIPTNIFGGHHAVILYPISTAWPWTDYVLNSDGQRAKVFDPWPRQKPEVVEIPQFGGAWGGVRADGYHNADPDNIFSGYPLTGYTGNLSGGELDFGFCP